MYKLNHILLLLLFTSCAGITPRVNYPDVSKSEKRVRKINKSELRKKKDVLKVVRKKEETPSPVLPKSIEKEVTVFDSSFDPKDKLNLHYSNKLFDFWKNYFTKRSKPRFIRHMKNGMKYKDLVSKVFKSHGLPEDLFFVGLIESGFNSHIRSHASAVGPWQFIKGTATRYGLRVDGSLDERRNIHKATEAAANYFKDLYNIFGSWELALCAYNAGEYRIINAIRKGNSRDYRELVRKKLIPKETIYYVPKVAAAREIFNNKPKHGFPTLKKESNFYDDGKLIILNGHFSPKGLARHIGVSLQTLKDLNPDFNNPTIYAKRGINRVIVPSKRKNIAKTFKPIKVKKRFYAKSSPKFYYVKKGDSLYSISRKYGTTISQMKKVNSLTKNFIYKGQKLLVPSSLDQGKYTVKKGDNLTKIARKFRTSVRKIASLNSLKSMRIYSGQRLRIPRG